MPAVARRRVIDAPVEDVWALVADPYHLPRWWPRVTRVENVQGEAGGKRARWTAVLGTEAGRGVRADYRCLSAARNERYLWEQEVEDTPFERILRGARTEVRMRRAGDGTEVTVEIRQSLRGLSRLGSPMMRRATGKTLNEALDGLDQALVGGE
ncbi:MAG: SRPBCC family protein [Solirubrobacterales bacterium]